MRRAVLLDTVLGEFTAAALSSVVPASSSKATQGSTDGFDAALRALQFFVRGDFDAAVEPAADALRFAADPDALAFARAVAGFALAGRLDAIHNPALRDPITGADPLLAAAADHTELSASLSPALLHLLAESALACARVNLAAQFLTRAGAIPDTLFGRQHPYLTVMRVLRMRVNAFQGNVAAANDLVAAALDGTRSPVEQLFAEAAACLVNGNSDQRRNVNALAGLIESSGIAPESALTRGSYLLAAYGLVAIGSVDQAARLVLAAGSDAELARLMIVDRALGFELLAASAVAAGDLDAAESWRTQATPLRDHPIAASTVARIESRVALLAGDAARAVEFAELAIRYARADDRLIEAAEGEIILARARIAATRRGEAAQRLERVVTDAAGLGHHAVRRAASRELREVGRRLRPVASSGLRGLSPREVEIATRMTAGLSNGAIAKELFLSEHTVRIHVSRVLHAFGVASRLGVATAMAGTTPGSVEATNTPFAPPLTPRQSEIVQLIVSGATNVEISRTLGISVKTVEKHVTDILQRWGASSRVGIARIALSERSVR